MSKVSNMTSSTTSTSRGDNRSLILAVATSTIAVAAAAGVAVYYYHNRRTAADCDNDGGDDLTRTAPSTTMTATAKEEAIQQDNGTEIEIVTKSRGLVLEDLSSIEAEEPKVVDLKFHETDEDEKHDLTPPSSEKEAGVRVTPIKMRRLASGRLNIPNEDDAVSSSSLYPSKPQELADSPSVTTAETSMTDDDSIHVASSMTQ